uniref:Uncharacterized protein n=1 Tax=Rhipicephalus microplus TaxID=6941 RepID=A0A6G5AGE1_RHIMP
MPTLTGRNTPMPRTPTLTGRKMPMLRTPTLTGRNTPMLRTPTLTGRNTPMPRTPTLTGRKYSNAENANADRSEYSNAENANADRSEYMPMLRTPAPTGQNTPMLRMPTPTGQKIPMPKTPTECQALSLATERKLCQHVFHSKLVHLKVQEPRGGAENKTYSSDYIHSVSSLWTLKFVSLSSRDVIIIEFPTILTRGNSGASVYGSCNTRRFSEHGNDG